MIEVWKPVVGFEGLYEVSSLGRVRSLDRYVLNGRHGVLNLIKGRMLRPKVSKHDGYLRLSLCKEGKIKSTTVHRVVATAFIPNPNDYPAINHINEITDDNRAVNLEWCTAKYNSNYGNHNAKLSKTKSYPLSSYTKDGKKLASYDNAKQASQELGYCQSGIIHACNGRLRSYKGLIWKYDNPMNRRLHDE